jgi:hypothetical protein
VNEKPELDFVNVPSRGSVLPKCSSYSCKEFISRQTGSDPVPGLMSV